MAQNLTAYTRFKDLIMRTELQETSKRGPRNEVYILKEEIREKTNINSIIRWPSLLCLVLESLKSEIKERYVCHQPDFGISYANNELPEERASSDKLPIGFSLVSSPGR